MLGGTDGEEVGTEVGLNVGARVGNAVLTANSASGAPVEGTTVGVLVVGTLLEGATLGVFDEG